MLMSVKGDAQTQLTDILPKGCVSQPYRAVLHRTNCMPKYGPRPSVFKQRLNKLLLIVQTAATEDV